MGYSRGEQLAARAAVRPALWARLAVNHTKKTCCAALLVPLAAVVAVVATGVFALDSPTGNDYFLRNDVRTRLAGAREDVLETYGFGGTADDARGTNRARNADVAVLFRGERVLTRENVARMKAVEDAVLADPRYAHFCYSDPNLRSCNRTAVACSPPESIVSHPDLYGGGSDDEVCRKDGAEPVSEEQWDRFLVALVTDDGNGKKVIDPDYVAYLGSDIADSISNSTVLTTAIARSNFVMGAPFKGFSTVDDRVDDQLSAYTDWADPLVDRINAFSTADLDVFAVGEDYANSRFDSIVAGDLAFAGASIVAVFVVIWIHTSSMMLAVFAMVQIILAFPVTYAFYRLVLQIKYFAALQIMTIFLILGIAADDVAVFTDAWAQAAVVLGSDVDLVTRMSWTYRRAVKAMSVTSVTTAAAFFVTATSSIMPISTLGIWAGVLVLVQFLFVICMYPCAIVGWQRFWRERHWKNCLRKKAEDDEDAPADIEETQQEQIQESADRHVPMWHRCLPEKWRPEPVAKAAEGDYRAAERFFRGPWVNLIRKLRFAIIALGIVLVGVGIYLATRLEPPEETEQFLPSSNPVRAALIALEESFPILSSAYQLEVAVGWGISDIDNTGVSKYKPELRGKAVLDESFQLRFDTSQQAVLDACKTFRGNKKLVIQDSAAEFYSCWAEDFKTWLSTAGNDNFVTYETDEDLVKAVRSFANFTDDKQRKPYLKYLTSQKIVLSTSQDRVLYTEVRFVSPTKALQPYKVMWPIYNDWQDELSKLNKAAAEGANRAIATAGYPWQWQITQRALVRSMFQGVGVMLAVALVSLALITRNWVMAILATVSIGGIVSNLLGLVYLLGWSLGVTESIGVVISIGYAFDGVAHICTAYVESKSETRFDRTRDALTDLGISIIAGGVSTLLAGSFLFFAVIIFFVKFGGFIVSTVILSMLWSLLFFPAILQTIGPVGNVGSLAFIGTAISRCIAPLTRKRREKELVLSDDSSDYLDATPQEG